MDTKPRKQIHVYSLGAMAFFTDEEINVQDRKDISREEKKRQLKTLFDNHNDVRALREEFLDQENVVSLFESNLTRTLCIDPDSLTLDIVIVNVSYYGIFQDLIYNGFSRAGEKYVPLTASAGQTRKKKFVFIKEALWQEHALKLMCGLTVDHINEKGGINISKYLAYLALNETATNLWPEFDIDRCIVVDDFETAVNGLVDIIDTASYEISRQNYESRIPHTDGCGMVLPVVSDKNFMVRLPWVKGLLASFPFDEFIRKANRNGVENHGIVTDIYGQQHDVLAENIQIIFTKSQFKMWKYYDSWDQYKQFFKEYECEAGICNVEEDYFDQARTTYQMLQTLTDLTDEELESLSSKTTRKINKISSDLAPMQNVFGARKINLRKTPFQKALLLYPELLQDAYCRTTLRDIKDKIVREAVSGKLDIDGYYTFLLPDLYAFCQWLFLGDHNPTGLLEAGEVYCRLFNGGAEVDCLRSPHLYREHAVRKNVYHPNSTASKWFKTNAVYTSSHDLITRILMNDVDGDTSLVVEDPVLVNAAKRNMEGIVPLYYELGTAMARQINKESIYESIVAAYHGSNIGTVSNDITRVWNIVPFTDEHLEVTKILTMEANATVDYPKTLYKPERPEYINNRIQNILKGIKLPRFFIEAKGEEETAVATWNKSCVNRLRSMIPDPSLDFDFSQVGQFDWTLLISKKRLPNKDIQKRIIDTFSSMARSIKFTERKHNDEEEETDWRWECLKIRKSLQEIYSDTDVIAKVLASHLFSKETPRKKVFWECFGEEVFQNLKKNLGTNSVENTIICQNPKCRRRVKKTGRSQKLCPECAKEKHNEQKSINKKRMRRGRHS